MIKVLLLHHGVAWHEIRPHSVESILLLRLASMKLIVVVGVGGRVRPLGEVHAHGHGVVVVGRRRR